MQEGNPTVLHKQSAAFLFGSAALFAFFTTEFIFFAAKILRFAAQFEVFHCRSRLCCDSLPYEYGSWQWEPHSHVYSSGMLRPKWWGSGCDMRMPPRSLLQKTLKCTINSNISLQNYPMLE